MKRALVLLFATTAAADTATWTAKDGLPPANAVLETDDGRLLIGGPSGLHTFDGKRFELEQFTQVGKMVGNDLYQVTLLADGNWIGAPTGLYRLRRNKSVMPFGQRVPGTQPLGVEPTVAMQIDHGGPWVATTNHLFRKVPGTYEEIFDANGVAVGGVRSMAKTTSGTWWFSTETTVLRFVDDVGNGKFVDAGAATTLPGKLATDSEETLWIGREDGLWRVRATFERVDPRPVTAILGGAQVYVANTEGVFVIEGGKLAEVIDHPSATTLALGRRALWAADSGRLSLATLPGDGSPPVLELASKRLERDGGAMDVVVDYTVKGAVGAHGVEFRYRLDGVDRDWIAAGARTRATYDDLPPGSYEFHVEGKTARSPWSREIGLRFVVEPRFWQTTWFKASVVGGLITMLVVFGVVLHVRRKRREVAAAAAVEKRVETEVASARETERLAAYGQMVAGVAHEVRQPLFAISTVSYTLQESLKGKDPELAPQMALLDREVKRMSGMMDDLLDFARPAQLLKGPTEVAPLLAETLDIVGSDGEGPTPTIGAIDVKEVVIDRARMQQVLVNLVQNARRHAQGAKTIAVSAIEDGALVKLEVRDDGAPIPPQQVARLFEPFFTTGKGTGLGLPIAKRIVELHDGTLTVRSDASGTCFTITIPRGG